MKKILFFLVTGLMGVSCTTHSSNQSTVAIKENSQPQLASDGKTLLKQRCYVCHTEKPGEKAHDQMLAPPMLGVKKHYIQAYPDKKTFIGKITEWVKTPSAAKALMPGAVKRWNVMPALNYPDSELQKIAEAIYELPLPKGKQGKNKCGNGKCGGSK